jgi:aromatic-L-amino-acid decarboxylase
MDMDKVTALQVRNAPLTMSAEEFRQAGYQLIDRITELFTTLAQRPVSPDISPAEIRELLAKRGISSLPEKGCDVHTLLEETTRLLFEHSVFNGHPRFMGMITSSAAPIGILGDLLADAVNANVHGWLLAPLATEIEAQTVRWIAELIGYPGNCGGLLVSGGNVGNLTGFLAARTAKAQWDVRNQGLTHERGQKLRFYASSATHTWIHKTADLCGLGLDALRWIPAGADQRIDVSALRAQIDKDITDGLQPFLVIGTAGTVGIGSVDPLPELASLCREYNLWFHVDGAYGGCAAMLLDSESSVSVPEDLRGLREADSVAIDPHKWLYTPLEAGCVLVRDAKVLHATFSAHTPPYYHGQDNEEGIYYYEYGLQNSRSFRALKVWLALRQVGRSGYLRMLADDIMLARELYRLTEVTPELEAYTQHLSITTFRYAPPQFRTGSTRDEGYLNRLNMLLLERLQRGGEAFVSNAIVDGAFLLRACIVNFRTALPDIEMLIDTVVRLGCEIDRELRITSS